MRRSVIVAAAMLAAVWSLPAKAAVVFVGRMIVLAAPGCADFTVGYQDNARYHLSDLPDNGPETTLGFFGPYGVMNMRKTGRFTSTFAPVIGTSIASKPGSFSARVRIINSVPDDNLINANTPGVFLTGQVEGADDSNGAACTITFRAAFVRR